jgi:hypothetical protein
VDVSSIDTGLLEAVWSDIHDGTDLGLDEERSEVGKRYSAVKTALEYATWQADPQGLPDWARNETQLTQVLAIRVMLFAGYAGKYYRRIRDTRPFNAAETSIGNHLGLLLDQAESLL